MGVIWGDYNGDGWPDLYVTNDYGATFLYHNQKNGTFKEVGMVSGTAVGPDGRGYGNMAADFAISIAMASSTYLLPALTINPPASTGIKATISSTSRARLASRTPPRRR